MLLGFEDASFQVRELAREQAHSASTLRNTNIVHCNMEPEKQPLKQDSNLSTAAVQLPCYVRRESHE